jgi:hypothetical protein
MNADIIISSVTRFRKYKKVRRKFCNVALKYISFYYKDETDDNDNDDDIFTGLCKKKTIKFL